ncbi:hypothetical protein [Noviherbaspirillum galbum]|uniref:Uncharacterized protein n=1 Tax=Noviherbaspirillum galbum TaxID=2709383 RepID=A0A6B3SU12_9BURK|nr:hypothetical protein [Noviherbaspirillum galbum]NEX64490.1 hypothetical protein [Noviherbaspirillum galbum]
MKLPIVNGNAAPAPLLTKAEEQPLKNLPSFKTKSPGDGQNIFSGPADIPRGDAGKSEPSKKATIMPGKGFTISKATQQKAEAMERQKIKDKVNTLASTARLEILKHCKNLHIHIDVPDKTLQPELYAKFVATYGKVFAKIRKNLEDNYKKALSNGNGITKEVENHLVKIAVDQGVRKLVQKDYELELRLMMKNMSRDKFDKYFEIIAPNDKVFGGSEGAEHRAAMHKVINSHISNDLIMPALAEFKSKCDRIDLKKLPAPAEHAEQFRPVMKTRFHMLIHKAYLAYAGGAIKQALKNQQPSDQSSADSSDVHQENDAVHWMTVDSASQRNAR